VARPKPASINLWHVPRLGPRAVGGGCSSVAAAKGVETAAIKLGRSSSRALWFRRDIRRRLGREILIEGLGEARRSAPLGDIDHAYDRQVARMGGRHHVAIVHEPARLQHPLAVDTDPAVRNEAGGTRARLHEACAPQPLVEALLRQASALLGPVARGEAVSQLF
jgi:hypothetical protein